MKINIKNYIFFDTIKRSGHFIATTVPNFLFRHHQGKMRAPELMESIQSTQNMSRNAGPLAKGTCTTAALNFLVFEKAIFSISLHTPRVPCRFFTFFKRFD